MVELDRWDGLDLRDLSADRARRRADRRQRTSSSSTSASAGTRCFGISQTGVAAYGVTTGLGYLASETIGEDDQAALQRSLLTARASGLGSPLPGDVVRGAMLLRLVGFLSGFPGATPELCRFLADRLNEGWSPVVPRGPYGASGEIAPLAHLFQTFIGEGLVELDGERVPAPGSARSCRHRTVRPGGRRRASRSSNGSPFATALGARLGRSRSAAARSGDGRGGPRRRGRRRLRAAVRGSRRLARARRCRAAGRAAPAASSCRGLRNGATSRNRPCPSASCLRCTRRSRERSMSCEATVEARLRSVTDSPVLLDAQR